MTPFRKLALFLAVNILLLGVLGCSRVFVEPTPTPPPVVLRFAFSNAMQESRYQDAAKAFKLKNPNITVEVVRTNNVSRSLSGGNIDVFEAEQFDFASLLQREAIRDLTPILQSAADFPINDYYPKLLEVYRQGGRTWGIPSAVDPIVIFYNKDLFQKMNVPAPKAGWNWQDFVLTASKLSLTSQDPPQYGFMGDQYGIGIWAFAYQHGAKLVDNLLQPTKATLDTPEVKEAVQWYVDLALRQKVMPALTPADTYGWRNVSVLFLQGKVGMWLLPLSERGGILTSSMWPFSWGVVPLPQERERIAFLLSSAYFISSGTTHPRESWMWIEYLVKEVAMESGVPPRRSIAESEAYRKRVGDEMYAVAQEAAKYGMTLPSAAWLTQIPAGSIGLIGDVMSQKKTVDEALYQMQQQWDQAIRSLNKQ